MTVNTVSPAIISRAEFNRNAGQTKTPQLVRMDFGNLLTNGGFDTDTDWTKGTGWTIAAGVADCDGTQGGNTDLSQTIGSALKLGVNYLLSADLTQSAGTVFPRLGGTDGTTYSATGSISDALKPDDASTTNILFRANSTFVGTLDNVSIYEADPSDDAPWLRLPYGYSVGRTGMIVRDGVVLHPSDYSEVKDSGQTWIKPLVAPGVSTEFSIWGSPSYAV